MPSVVTLSFKIELIYSNVEIKHFYFFYAGKTKSHLSVWFSRLDRFEGKSANGYALMNPK